MHLVRIGALFAILLGLAACTGAHTATITQPAPHMGDGTDML